MGSRFVRLGTAAAILFVLVALPGCAFFSGKPPLPKHASLEHVTRSSSAAEYAALVAEADVIYFPDDRAASGARSEPAALLLEALQQTGKPLTIGWDSIDAAQQPLLDELQTNSGAEREALIGRLELIGTGRAREHCRAVLREAAPGVGQLALRCPAALRTKIVSGESLTSDEEKFWPRGYRTPAGGLETYAERMPQKRGVNDRSLAESYRVQMLGQQFTAESIVRHFKTFGSEGKLLAFVSRADLEAGRGIPTYVAQKIKLRQLVLGPDAPRKEDSRLLTAAR